MKNGGKVCIAVLAVILIIAVLYDFFGISNKEATIPEENVLIVEASEQEEAMEHEAFVKEEYVSVLPEGENLALNGKVDADSFADVYVPRKVIDGRSEGVSYWEGAADSYPNTLTVKLEEPSQIHAVRLCLCPQNVWAKRTQEIEISISTDGENFEVLFPKEAYEFDPDRGNEVILNFDSTEAAAVRLTFYSNTGAAGGQLAEFEIYG